MKNSISFHEFQGTYFDRKIPIKDLKDHLGVPLSKILAYWRRHGLLPFIPDGKKAMINLPQLIWLRILDDLRKINFPLSKMQKVCNYFFKDAYDKDLPKLNMEKTKESLLKQKQATGLSEDEQLFLEYIESTLADPKLLYIYKFDVNFLSDYIYSCTRSGEDGTIFIFFDGSVSEYIGNNYWGHKDPIDLKLSHIRLTLSSYLKEFINDYDLSTLLLPQLLGEDELTVLKEMRRKNIKEINIHRNDPKDNWRIETVTDGIVKDADAQKLRETLGLKNYEAIELKTVDEKTLYFKVKKKNIGFGNSRPN